LRYTDAIIDPTIRERESESLENMPVGLDAGLYRWVDWNGEGVTGILTEQGNQWFYKPNIGNGRLVPSNV
jgi:hypothetical protein